MTCNICGGKTELIHHGLVLGKYDVDYFRCLSCKFIQTQTPTWLPEAYQSAITGLDVGLLSRNLYFSRKVPPLIDLCFSEAKKFLDYGGGLGLFVRLMRDKGYDFYRQDVFCENTFAKHFDLTDLPVATSFDLVTAFEVFEHLQHPLEEIEKVLQFSSTVLFSTVVAPVKNEDFKTWWYVSTETGQHISFYSIESLQFIANKFRLNFYSNGINVHLLTEKQLSERLVKKCFTNKVAIKDRLINKLIAGSEGNRSSLLEADYEFLLKMMQNNSRPA